MKSATRTKTCILKYDLIGLMDNILRKFFISHASMTHTPQQHARHRNPLTASGIQ